MRSETSLGRALLGSLLFGLALPLECNAVLNNPPGQAESSDAGAPGASSAPPSTAEDATLEASLATSSDATTTTAEAGTVPSCGLGEKLCNGACVSVSDPLFGCGPNACAACALAHATPACAASGCVIATCNPGYADCDGDPADGCETDLSQAAHCGACNATCSAVAPYCAPVGAIFGCVTGCTGSAPTLCGSQCVNLQSSLDDCGACANACPSVANGQATCSEGRCAFACDTSFHVCGDACASDVSPESCGTGCAPCPSGPNAVATCGDGHCGIACEPGYADCDGVAANGCEVDVLTDPRDCGACGYSCNGGTCSDGVCTLPPPVDSGPPPPLDAGPPPVDAGPPPADAGPPPIDGGTPPPTDSGPPA